MKMTDARAIVTGGARGMGRHFTRALREAGASVLFCDIDEQGVGEASDALGVPGVRADVSNEEDVSLLFEAAEEALGGPVNVLLNNAGITRDGLLVKKDRKTGELKPLSRQHWDQVLNVNLTGPFLCMREFAMRCIRAEVPSAVAVNMSSVTRAGNVGQTNYSATKAGLVADTVLWARELARYGIRVGAVAPGFIRTPMVEAMPEKARDRAIQAVPLRRLGEPEEVWQAVRFVVECDYFSGRVVEVDGGLRL